MTSHSQGKRSSRKEPLLPPKGTRDLVGNEYLNYQGFAEKAAEIALYYGFKPVETPILEHEEVFTSGLSSATDIVGKEMYTLRTKGSDRLALRPEGTAPLVRAYLSEGMQALPQPVMAYYYGPYFRHDNPQRGRYREFRQFGLEVMGSPKSIYDALIVRLCVTILGEAGIKNPCVEVNSLGCKECREGYRRELSSYYRKHAKEVCAECRERLKSNPLRVLDCKNPKCAPIKESAPESIAYLCTECKKHFKEFMEYLDEMDVTYRINGSLVRGLDYYSRTVFEIISGDSAEEGAESGSALALGGGGRYDYLARALGSKKDVPAMGASLGVDRILLSPSYTPLHPRIIKKPEIFFIQLGFDAKLRSFQVTEILRKARIPIAHSLGKDSLGTQLGIAEKMDVPYCIILGQKEVIDGTVIVRTMANRSQDTVKLEKLPEYLKHLKR
ncbi:MAG: Histidine-tRNA ligase [Parcubacteria group bacterium GW2011_GWF2_52_12]|uniref:Histidine--tRNA ligase n=1 Tax=Candidatus Vogelbacteria bacterium RIFOXYD1_FULL_51_18 TaxID=1802440 RepID=A0A1G2QHY5_9BACT|nr:MAG: Histidine-tRNA ligase [Parcubacteria group bacterium GW2011_GWC1_51_35]KKW25338.1 MAG: Histidine-tRNA ligase [Parcubacteria group bacterium GW2011_GWF2_52_12]KKW27313.1 MAG: Histidine-tRNA ligase [Parcubacteria group bacterium GW2011_GWF1_52_5]KKW35040.1 MAG: Histidine-tRNA ligase [Parcubacteria group bacterium GW2011_GWB1_53_43]KKW38790.1 MAG: Histidine-tRNA ligase [Parcubacteria group bacterium GW2011_GWA1_54_88]OHA60206.1 MAG: histidine--tRNA ligase [Candidatus Vogelbacteria bacteri